MARHRTTVEPLSLPCRLRKTAQPVVLHLKQRDTLASGTILYRLFGPAYGSAKASEASCGWWAYSGRKPVYVRRHSSGDPNFRHLTSGIIYVGYYVNWTQPLKEVIGRTAFLFGVQWRCSGSEGPLRLFAALCLSVPRRQSSKGERQMYGTEQACDVSKRTCPRKKDRRLIVRDPLYAYAALCSAAWSFCPTLGDYITRHTYLE